MGSTKAKANAETAGRLRKKVKELNTKDMGAKMRDLGVEITRQNVFFAYPEDLTLVRDKKSRLYDPRVDDPVDEVLLADIAANGVHTALKVRENGLDKAGKPILQVIAGRRRVTALLYLNKLLVEKGEERKKVKFDKVRGSDQEMILIALSENSHRKGESVFSRAVKIDNAIKEGASHAQIKERTGMNHEQIERYLAFLNLSPEAQKAVEDKEIGVGAIDALATVPRAEQAVVLDKVKAQTQDGKKAKNHVVAQAAEAVRSGKPEDFQAPDALRLCNRNQIEDMASYCYEVMNAAKKGSVEHSEAMTGFHLLSFLLGHRSVLKLFPVLKLAAESAGVQTTEPEKKSRKKPEAELERF